MNIIKKAILKTPGKFSDYIFPFFYSRYINNIKSVGILLGPYGNLSTLTASVMSLHPACQVLNHAGQRIFNNKKINFLENYSEKKFHNFLKFAVYASLYGKRGDYGGGIFYSHAFDHGILKNKYYERFSSDLKTPINCIFWKESLKVSNQIKIHGIDNILRNNIKIKFILPVRNPLNCAQSNLRTGQYKNFNEPINNIVDCIKAIFKEFLFFLKMKEKHPDYFFYFFENNFIEKLSDIADFLNLEKEKKWLADSSEIIIINNKYDNEKSLISTGIELANAYFKEYQEFRDQIIEMINN